MSFFNILSLKKLKMGLIKLNMSKRYIFAATIAKMFFDELSILCTYLILPINDIICK